MNEELNNIQYSAIRDYNYSLWFKEIQCNGKILSDSEKVIFKARADEAILSLSEGLPLMRDTLESIKDLHDEFHKSERIISSILLFVTITSIDSMVASKFFLLAENDYEKRFMRGKLMVILNEGFKKLYGFKGKNNKESEWSRLVPILNHFPPKIKLDYNKMTGLLDEHSKSSPWWKIERDVETHLGAEELYDSRQEDINESKVMMDFLKLFSTLTAVNYFLTNAHGCLVNYLINQYYSGGIH